MAEYMPIARTLLLLVLPPIMCVATLVAIARAARLARAPRPRAGGFGDMSAWRFLAAISCVATQSLGFLLDPMDGAIGAGLFLVLVLLLRRAAAGGFAVAVAGVAIETTLAVVVAWSIYANAPAPMLDWAMIAGMFVPCALTLLVLLGALVAFVAAGRRERDPSEKVPLRTYVAVTLWCALWYALGALVHWSFTGPPITNGL